MLQSRSSTLLVATSVDHASLNIVSALTNRNTIWKELSVGKVWQSNNPSNVYLWLQESPLLHLNYPDSLFKSQFQHIDHKIDDIVFLSRHSAASGIASLTVHPIGISWTTDITRNGGLPGRCSPPSYRISSLYRCLSQRVSELDKGKSIQVTLEATHHGPFVDKPTCFVEIGSSPNEWEVKEYGEIWADVLIQHFKLQPSSSSIPKAIEKDNDTCIENIIQTIDNIHIPSQEYNENEGNKKKDGVVMMVIGGGHYVPKMNDAMKFGDGIYVGHCLASYTLKPYFDYEDKLLISPTIIPTMNKVSNSPQVDQNNEMEGEGKGEGEGVDKDANDDNDPNPSIHFVTGGWKHVITEAVTSTRLAYPDMKIICLVDKKAFVARHRDNILYLLDELQCVYTFKLAEVKALWEKEMKLKTTVV